jgi:dolichol-phosphate mannosyltransferase
MSAAPAAKRARTRARVVLPTDLTVVVPTRNEADAIGPFLMALEPALHELQAEVIIVDDSSDDTPTRAAVVADALELPMELVHRPQSDRPDGLGGAVKRGFELAHGRFVAVMDADLQHPPALVPAMLARARRDGADLVVASRFAAGGRVDEFGHLRRLVSRGSAGLARLLFRRQLEGVSDPMSGFFLVRRDRLRPEALRPKGFKILLEVLVRCSPLRVAEVPYTFGERAAGESKASLREGLRYLGHLLRLRLEGRIGRLTKFGVVGASGLIVNTAALALMTERAGVHYLISALLATQLAIGWNYLLSETWVFRAVSSDGSRLRRLGWFAVVNNLALAAGVPLLWLLVFGLHIHYVTANLLSIVTLMLARFAIADTLIWRARESPAYRIN